MDLFWTPASGHLLTKANALHFILTTHLIPHQPYKMSALYSLILQALTSPSGTKMTDYLNSMVCLFHNPDTDSDVVGDSLLKEPD